jgi:hypothetical protein
MAKRPQRPHDERGPRILALPFTHFRQLDGWRRAALAGAIIVLIGALSGIPDFGWLEATQVLVAISSIRMLARYVETNPFATPFADGTLLAVGGMWTAIVTLINAWDGARVSTSVIIVGGCALLFVSGMIIRWDEGRRWYEHDYAAE